MRKQTPAVGLSARYLLAIHAAAPNITAPEILFPISLFRLPLKRSFALRAISA